MINAGSIRIYVVPLSEWGTEKEYAGSLPLVRIADSNLGINSNAIDSFQVLPISDKLRIDTFGDVYTAAYSLAFSKKTLHLAISMTFYKKWPLKSGR